MISEKDVRYRTVLYLNALEGRTLAIRNGELLISDTTTGETFSKLAFQKLLAVFVIGKCTLTSPVLEAFSKHSVPFCVMKQSLRPVLWKADMAEGNYLLRRRQHFIEKEDISVARMLVVNKIENGISLLERKTGNEASVSKLRSALASAMDAREYPDLMSIEAHAAKAYLNAWFEPLHFQGRKPRMKCDPVNVSLDLGYSILFNFVEANLRFFGFDLYVGVYHRLFFQRKSLVCDVMEPMRCIIEKETLDAFSNRMFRKSDFEEKNGTYTLKKDKAFEYYKAYASAVLGYKERIFRYVRDYYRAFMKGAPPQNYPIFRL